MTKIDDHRAVLAVLGDWMLYLAANSGLLGPRGNLELVAACGEEAALARAEPGVLVGGSVLDPDEASRSGKSGAAPAQSFFVIRRQ